MTDKHLREWTPADLPALATADDKTLDRLCHELMRREDWLPCGGCLGSGTDQMSRAIGGIGLHVCLLCDGRKTQRRPIEPLCRPDVPLDRLVMLVQALRLWTGRALYRRVYSDSFEWFSVTFIDRGAIRSDLDDFDNSMRIRYRHEAHATVIACLAAAIIYGQKGDAA